MTRVSPFVFVIEDMQWLDSGSWNILSMAKKWDQGLMMVGTTRPVRAPASEGRRSAIRARDSVVLR